jgi:hypothetical protein
MESTQGVNGSDSILNSEELSLGTIQTLPPEVIANIFSCLSGVDLFQVREVCRSWKLLASTDFLWKQRIPWIAGNILQTLNSHVKKQLLLEDAFEKKSFEVRTFSGGLSQPLTPTNFFIHGSNLFADYGDSSYICIDIVNDKTKQRLDFFNCRVQSLIANEQWLLWHALRGKERDTSMWSRFDLSLFRHHFQEYVSAEVSNIPCPVKRVELLGNFAFFEAEVASQDESGSRKLVIVKNLTSFSAHHIPVDAWCATLSPAPQLFYYQERLSTIYLFTIDNPITMNPIIKIEDKNHPLFDLKVTKTSLVGCSEKEVYLWDRVSKALQRKIEVSFCIKAFAVDGHLAILYSADEGIHVFSLETGLCLSSFHVEGILQQANSQKEIVWHHLFYKNPEGFLSVYHLMTGCKVLDQEDWHKPFLKIQVIDNTLYGLHADGIKAYTFVSFRKKKLLS